MFFDKEFYLTFFPNKFNKSIVGVRAIIIDKDRYLLVKRSSTDRHNPNKWEFPGGSIENGEGLINSLCREVKEETGLEVTKVATNCYVTYHDVPNGSKSVYKGFRRYVLFYICDVLDCTSVKLSQEHSKLKWSCLESAFNLDLTEDTINYLNSVKGMV